VPAHPQPSRQLGEFDRRVLGKRLARALRAQLLGVRERPFQQPQTPRIGQFRQRDLVRLGDRVGEVGAEHDARDVGHHQQRWIAERPGIEQQLAIRRVEVAALLLVLPGEAVAPPDIGPAGLAGKAGGALLERVVLAGGVAVRRRLVEQTAEVDEMLLARRAFVARAGLPFRDEFRRGHEARLTPCWRFREAPRPLCREAQPLIKLRERHRDIQARQEQRTRGVRAGDP
jgi:hypothetical protein